MGDGKVRNKVRLRGWHVGDIDNARKLGRGDTGEWNSKTWLHGIAVCTQLTG